MSSPHFRRRAFAIVLFAAAFVFQARAGYFAQELIAETAILALLAMSLDLLAMCGLVSLGHAGFFGIGGYVFGGLTVLVGWPPGIALPLAIVAGALAGLAAGLLAVRTSGAFFIMVTLSLAEMFYAWAFRSKTFNGGDGMAGVPRLDLSGLGLVLDKPGTFAALTIALCLAVWLLLEFLALTPFGRTLAAIRQNPDRVAALGARVSAYRLAAFVASGALATFAGAMKVQHTNFITPDLATWLVSADVLVALVIGGMGTLVGGIVGAIVLIAARELLSGLFGHWYFALGAIFGAIALFMPDGIVGFLLRDRGKARPRPIAEPSEEPA